MNRKAVLEIEGTLVYLKSARRRLHFGTYTCIRDAEDAAKEMGLEVISTPWALSVEAFVYEAMRLGIHIDEYAVEAARERYAKTWETTPFVKYQRPRPHGPRCDCMDCDWR